MDKTRFILNKQEQGPTLFFPSQTVKEHQSGSVYTKFVFWLICPMVFILDGCSSHYAHTWSKSGISIC